MRQQGLVLLLLLTAGLAAQQPTERAQPPLRSKPPAVRELRNLAYHSGEDADPNKHKLNLYLPPDAKGVPVVGSGNSGPLIPETLALCSRG